MPTAERRFHLGLLLKTKQQEQEEMEKSQSNVKNAKGERKTKISGNALKSKLKSGEIPMS